METQTPTPKPKLEGAAPRKELLGPALAETAAKISGAIFWQTGATFADLCSKRRKYENARLVFCHLLRLEGADTTGLSKILNRRPTEIKELFVGYKERQMDPLFKAFSSKIWRFYHGFND